jgi:flavin reductase (DIM6/NTAB) family NADH-FMN oxidoreductase RutF
MYPRPALLVGAMVNGKPNFMTVGGGGVASGEPPMISLPIRHPCYTLKGIMQNREFSINTPSVDLVKETDYCGMVTGAKIDKVKNCGFNLFYGKLESVPLIEQCPINLECKLAHTLTLGSHCLVIGEVVESHVSEGCMIGDKLDVGKINALIFNMEQKRYFCFGEVVGDAWHVGKQLK